MQKLVPGAQETDSIVSPPLLSTVDDQDDPL
jgi:hypothetical protein